MPNLPAKQNAIEIRVFEPLHDCYYVKYRVLPDGSFGYFLDIGGLNIADTTEHDTIQLINSNVVGLAVGVYKMSHAAANSDHLLVERMKTVILDETSAYARVFEIVPSRYAERTDLVLPTNLPYHRGN